jgi:hypothetical protein
MFYSSEFDSIGDYIFSDCPPSSICFSIIVGESFCKTFPHLKWMF